jgi:hypothetical protein
VADAGALLAAASHCGGHVRGCAEGGCIPPLAQGPRGAKLLERGCRRGAHPSVWGGGPEEVCRWVSTREQGSLWPGCTGRESPCQAARSARSGGFAGRPKRTTAHGLPSYLFRFSRLMPPQIQSSNPQTNIGTGSRPASRPLRGMWEIYQTRNTCAAYICIFTEVIWQLASGYPKA